MESLITKYKVDLNEIEKLAIDTAFSENRIKVNEDGLSEEALEAKKTVIAYREEARLFTKHAFASMTASGQRITPADRRRIESIAMEAIERKEDGIEYLRQFCE